MSLHVGLAVVEEHLGLLRREVELDERGDVATAAVGEEGLAAGLVEAEELRRERVLVRDLADLAEAALAVGLHHREAAVLLGLHSDANLEVVVDRERGEAVVLLDELALAGRDVDAMEIVEALVAIVEPDEHLVRDAVADLLDARLRAVDRREVLVGAALQVDGVEVPVLVAVLVLHVEDVVVRERPAIGADAALLVLGDGLGLREIADGRDPDVEHAVDAREIGDALAVGAQHRHRAIGVREQRAPREERRVGARRLPRRRRGHLRRRGAERGEDALLLSRGGRRGGRRASTRGGKEDEAGGSEEATHGRPLTPTRRARHLWLI